MSTVIGGKKKEKQFDSFAKYIGFFKGYVAAVNPDRDDLNKLLGKEGSDNDKELDYTGEKEGVRTARITFWLGVDGHDGLYIPHTIMLKEEPWRNKAGDKIQLVNQTGDSQWVEADEDNNYSTKELFDSFLAFTNVLSWKAPNGDISEKYSKGAKPEEVENLGDKIHRIAVVGESELLDFMKVWMPELDLRDPSANLLLDTNKLFGGNFKDLTDLIGNDFSVRKHQGNTVPIGFTALAYVRVDDDDPDKQYQKVFRNFLPAKFIKFINNGGKIPDKYSQDTWEKFMKEVDGDYGPDGQFVLEPLKEYNPDDDFYASSETRPDVQQTETFKKSSKY